MEEPTLTGRCNAKRLATHLVVNKRLCPRLAYFPFLMKSPLQPDPWKCFRHAACLKTSVSNLLALPAAVIESRDAAAGAQLFHNPGRSFSV